MIKEYQIIDADGHVVEPSDLWEQHLPPDLAAIAPQRRGEHHWFYNGQKVPPTMTDILQEEFKRREEKNYKAERDAKWSPKSQVEAMDRLGLDISYLYPSKGLQLWAFRNMNPAVAAALVRIYNDWLFEFCSYDPKRLKPVPGLNLHDPKDAIAELKRVSAMGAKAVFVRPNPIVNETMRTLGDPAYEPLWTEAERLGISFGIHEGGGALPRVTDGRFTSQFACHTNHVFEQMLGFLAVLESGVLERHPTLQFAFLEAGCGWLPFWLWRLDEIEYKTNGLQVAANVKMKPSEYFRRQCYVSMEVEPYLGGLVKYIGEDRILFASDYPHPDHDPDMAAQIVEIESLVSKPVLKKILFDNPRRFYGEA